jgi:hypothetical protein
MNKTEKAKRKKTFIVEKTVKEFMKGQDKRISKDAIEMLDCTVRATLIKACALAKNFKTIKEAEVRIAFYGQSQE